MINIQCHFRAKCLHTPVNINVLLPSFFEHANTVESLDDVYKDNNPVYRTLFLLHGGVEDARSWLAYTNIEKYADKHNLAVILPSVTNSFYKDLKYGMKYWTFVSDELVRFVRSVFPLSEKREDTFVAGLSMGGYGALKMAFRHPEMFSAAICLSGGVDVATMFDNEPSSTIRLQEIFGKKEDFVGSENDLYYLMKKVKEDKKEMPRLYMACGFDDFLYEQNQKFLNFVKSQSIEVTYEEGPGAHEWDFWDTYIEKGLDWLDAE